MNDFKECAENFVVEHRRGIKIWILVILIGGMMFKGIMQQPQINKNRERIARLEDQIEYEQERQAEIENLKDKVNSDEYIEKMANEKLGLVKSTAKIFVDVSQDE